MAVTVAQLKTRALERADLVGSSFIGTGELDRYFQASWVELYDLLVSKFQDYFVDDPVDFTLATGSSTWSFPATYYKLMAVDRDEGGGRFREVKRANFNERHDQTARVKYRLMGSKVYFWPEEKAPGSYQAWLIPMAPVLGDGDPLPAAAEPWAEFIVVDVARKCLDKEEQDVSGLVGELAALRQRIEVMATSRDAGSSDRITDVRRGETYLDDWEGEGW